MGNHIRFIINSEGVHKYYPLKLCYYNNIHGHLDRYNPQTLAPNIYILLRNWYYKISGLLTALLNSANDMCSLYTQLTACPPGPMKESLHNKSVSVTTYHYYYSKRTSFHHSLQWWRSVSEWNALSSSERLTIQSMLLSQFYM